MVVHRRTTEARSRHGVATFRVRFVEIERLLHRLYSSDALIRFFKRGLSAFFSIGKVNLLQQQYSDFSEKQ